MPLKCVWNEQVKWRLLKELAFESCSMVLRHQDIFWAIFLGLRGRPIRGKNVGQFSVSAKDVHFRVWWPFSLSILIFQGRVFSARIIPDQPRSSYRAIRWVSQQHPYKTPPSASFQYPSSTPLWVLNYWRFYLLAASFWAPRSFWSPSSCVAWLAARPPPTIRCFGRSSTLLPWISAVLGACAFCFSSFRSF